MLFNSVYVEFLCSAVCAVASLFELRWFLPETQNSELTRLVKENVGHRIGKTCLTRRRVELFHYGYTVLDGFADASRLPVNVLNALGCPGSFLVVPISTIFDLVIRKLLREEGMKVEKSCKL